MPTPIMRYWIDDNISFIASLKPSLNAVSLAIINAGI